MQTFWIRRACSDCCCGLYVMNQTGPMHCLLTSSDYLFMTCDDARLHVEFDGSTGELFVHVFVAVVSSVLNVTNFSRQRTL